MKKIFLIVVFIFITCSGFMVQKVFTYNDSQIVYKKLIGQREMQMALDNLALYREYADTIAKCRDMFLSLYGYPLEVE